ncbi:MAG: hypothetical protein LIO93_12180 [Bacteroidales bacterium]|nr:hypothetical protein [Bacteroidales bacterium]
MDEEDEEDAGVPEFSHVPFFQMRPRFKKMGRAKIFSLQEAVFHYFTTLYKKGTPISLRCAFLKIFFS